MVLLVRVLSGPPRLGCIQGPPGIPSVGEIARSLCLALSHQVRVYIIDGRKMSH